MSQAAARKPQLVEEKGIGNPVRILVLVEDPGQAKSISDILASKGYSPVLAIHSEEALEAISRQDIAVALLQLEQDYSQGLALIRNIKKISPDTECILLDGFCSRAMAVKAINLGVSACLEEPINENRLSLAVCRAAEKRESVIRLRENEATFKSLFDISNAGKSITRLTGEMQVNQALCDMLGYSRKELQGKTWQEITPPEDIPLTQAAIQPLLDGKKSKARFTKRYFRKDGSLLWGDVHVAMRCDARGNPLHFITTVVDITDRIQLEGELQALNTRQQAILEAVPDIIVEVDNDKVYTWANPAGLAFFGEDVIGKPADHYFVGKQDVYKRVAPLFDGDENVIYLESWQRRRDGEARLLAWWCRVLKRADGKVTGTISSARDITDQKELSDALVHSHDLMGYIIDHNRSAVAVHDRDLKYIYVSQQYLDEYGVKDRHVIGKHHYEVFPDLLQKWRDVHQRALAGEVLSGEDDPYEHKDGSVDWTRWECRPWYEADGTIGGIIIYTEVINEKKQAEEYLRSLTNRQESLLAAIPEILVELDRKNILVWLNPAGFSFFGEDAIGKPAVENIIDSPNFTDIIAPLLEGSENVVYFESLFRRRDGETRLLGCYCSTIKDQGGMITGGLLAGRDITEQKRNLQALAESADTYHWLYEYAPIPYHILASDGTITAVNRQWCEVMGYTAEEVTGRDIFDFIADEEREGASASFRRKVSLQEELVQGRERGFITRNGEERTFQIFDYFSYNADSSVKSVQTTLVDVTASKQQERELRLVAKISASLRVCEKRGEIITILLDELIANLDVDGAEIEMLDLATGDLTIESGRGVWEAATGKVIPAGKGMSAEILHTEKPYLNNAADKDKRHIYRDLFGDCKAAAGVPMIVHGQTIGLLWIGSIRMLTDSDLRLLTAVADIAANAIHRTTLYEKTIEHLNQLSALRQIDQTINSSLDLRISLELILKHGHELLQADALAVLLYNPHNLHLDYAASTGFQTDAIRQTHIRIGDGLPGRAALERRMVSSVNLRGDDGVESRRALAEAEGFYIYHAAPLVVKGEIKGILEVYHRSIAFRPDAEWMNIFTSLATQAAIAIDNTSMFDGLQRTTQNLMLAYEETIEGWAKALEQRDHVTEGHTQRTKDLTIRLAKAAGIPESDMPHIVRGILLHDIGKMGIPDAILNKPGPLTDAEWEIMRSHPDKAYKMLSSIKYLKSSLEIPYCHHEKWDGTGYPRRLKGEEIPLPARIFTIVDVYDALTSDRPYRKAWTQKKTLAYIQEQSGRQFDPEMVKLFFKAMKG